MSKRENDMTTPNKPHTLDEILDELTAVWDETSDILPGTTENKKIGVGFTIVGKDRAKASIIDYIESLAPVPPREANELYPQDYVNGYRQATDDFLAKLNKEEGK